MTKETEPTGRPRVEGEREREIHAATLEVLRDVGYDRLTMDAVAQAARASKATLYRRWTTKSTLVIDALLSMKDPQDLPDHGNLRDDLISFFCGVSGITDKRPISLLAGVLTAIHRDEEFGEEFRTRFIGPKIAASRVFYERAAARGELRDDLDIDLFAAALAGIVLHRVYLLGDAPVPELVTRVVDQIIIPAACR